MTSESLRIPFRATEPARPYDGIRHIPVIVLLDNVRSLYNVGAFFRTADAVGAARVLLSGISARPPDRRIAKTALGAEAVVAWEAVTGVEERIDRLRAEGYEIAVAETGAHAVDLFDWRPVFPVCVVFGHETQGVRAPIVHRADTLVRIPTLGVKHSLNVATAGGVILYELLRKYRELVARPVSGRHP